MRRHAFRLGAILPLLLFPLLGTGATPPTPPSAQPAPQQYCVNWTVPDMNPTPEVQRRLLEIKAKTGVTLTQVNIGKRVCFATEQERQLWLQQNGPQEYRKWLQTQSGYQGYLNSLPSARKSGSDTSALTIQSAMSATLYWNAGYGGYAEPFYFADGCAPGGFGWGINWVGSSINDQASSSKFSPGSGCAIWEYYFDIDYGGGYRRCANYDADGSRNCYYVGDEINDQTSSFGIYSYP